MLCIALTIVSYDVGLSVCAGIVQAPILLRADCIRNFLNVVASGPVPSPDWLQFAGIIPERFVFGPPKLLQYTLG